MNDPSRPAQIAQAMASAAAAAEPSAEASSTGGPPPASLSSAGPGQPAPPQQQRTIEAVAVEATGSSPSAATRAAPKVAFWEQVPNLVLLLILLYLAVGTVCEISSRNEDYGRVDAHHKWLLSCLNGGSTDKGCPTGTGLNNRLEIAATQLRRYDSLNTVGVGSKCLTAAVIAAPLPGFHETCLALMSNPPVDIEPERRPLLASIVSPSWLSVRAAPLRLDEHPRDLLYFFLVLVSAAIGSLIGGLRVAGITTLKDLTLGLGAGFAVYLMLRSGSFVSLTSSVNVDILNPFSAGAVGMLVGLFSDKAFKLVDGLFGTNRVTVDAARMTTGPAAPR